MRWLILPVLQSVRLKILMGSFIYLVAGNYKDSMGNFGELAAASSVRTVTLWLP